MASPTISQARISYLGPFRVSRFKALCAGSADTLAVSGFYATDTTTFSALKCLTWSPTTSSAVRCNPRITSVSSNVPTITFDGGEANDEFVMELWRF